MERLFGFGGKRRNRKSQKAKMSREKRSNKNVVVFLILSQIAQHNKMIEG